MQRNTRIKLVASLLLAVPFGAGCSQQPPEVREPSPFDRPPPFHADLAYIAEHGVLAGGPEHDLLRNPVPWTYYVNQPFATLKASLESEMQADGGWQFGHDSKQYLASIYEHPGTEYKVVVMLIGGKLPLDIEIAAKDAPLKEEWTTVRISKRAN